MIWITLPYPPSTNRLWRTGNGRTYISSEAKAFKHLAQIQAVRVAAPWIVGPVRLDVVLHPKARKDGKASLRCIDLTNSIKAAEDALQGVCFENDSQVVSVLAQKSDEAVPGGMLRVMVRPA